MEAPRTPSTPQNTNPSHLARRSFTAPPKSKSSPSSISSIREAEAEGAETLFAHHACRIVSFNLSNRVWRRHSSFAHRGSELSTEPVGILPWASAIETTVSTGMTYRTDCSTDIDLWFPRSDTDIPSARLRSLPQLRQYFTPNSG